MKTIRKRKQPRKLIDQRVGRLKTIRKPYKSLGTQYEKEPENRWTNVGVDSNHRKTIGKRPAEPDDQLGGLLKPYEHLPKPQGNHTNRSRKPMEQLGTIQTISKPYKTIRKQTRKPIDEKGRRFKLYENLTKHRNTIRKRPRKLMDQRGGRFKSYNTK